MCVYLLFSCPCSGLICNSYSLVFFKLVESREDKQPSDTEVQAAVWEACGDGGALQLLTDLLSMK